MSVPTEDGFQKAFANFSSRLTKKEMEDFKFSSIKDVRVAVMTIQEEQGRRKKMMNMTRIRRFLEAMEQYGKVIEVFLNASSILCFVWGPMKFCLQVASAWTESFDTLLDAYKQLAESIPLLEQYQVLFRNNQHMIDALSEIYADILEFHGAALRVFKQPTWRQLFRSVWKDFKTRFQHILDDLNRHKALVESQASLVQYRESQAARASVRNSFTILEEAERKNRHIVVINWLSATDAILDQEASKTMRNDYPAAGRWVFEDPKMKAWVDPGKSAVPLLWMHGIPGAGKTILASVIVEESSRINSIAVAFFYCKYQDETKKTFLSIARALLAQLLSQNEDLLPYLYDQCIGSGQVALVSLQMCTELLETAFKTMPKAYVIIDGLDECDTTERKAILSFFTSLIEGDDSPGKLRVLIVSQDENDIRKQLRTASVLRLNESHNKGDIESFATKWSLQIQQKFATSQITQAYIVSAVCEGSDGMFLYARLVLLNLFSQTSPERLYEELRPGTFPKGFEQAYLRIVTRIYQNPKENELQTAKKLLGWISCSKRPLKWHEIQGAVSIDVEDESVDFDGRRLCTNIRDLCGSLIDILPGDTVQLVHSTAREFLIHNKYVQVSTEEYKLAILCLQYLILEPFNFEISSNSVKDFLLKGYYAFQDYAVLHWVDHLETLVQFLPLADPKESHELGAAIKDFYDAYGAEAGNDDISDQLKERCILVKGTKYYDNLLLLLGYTRRIRSADEQMIALGDLGKVVTNSRSVLEELHGSNTLGSDIKDKLNQYYGPNWNRCPRHACFYFHEGFPDATRRDNHVSRHEKPFCCTESSCPRIHHGFGTEKELKKHMSINHPDPAAFAWRFPKTKKPAQKYTCTECDPPKEYTRAHNLRIHKRTHKNERPFACEFCTKAFVRKHDRERHVENVHGSREMRGSSQEMALDLDAAGSDLGPKGLPESMSRADTLVDVVSDSIIPA